MTPDIHRIERFLSPGQNDRILAALRTAEAESATIYGAAASVDVRVRNTARLMPPPSIGEEVRELLLARKGELERHFATEPLMLEPLQFLRYREGDFFVAHQDGNTPLVQDGTLFRRVSVVLFLNRQSAEPQPASYSGGSFIVHTRTERIELTPAPGTLIAFPSETTHEVTPVTRGQRYTAVGWFRDAAHPG